MALRLIITVVRFIINYSAMENKEKDIFQDIKSGVSELGKQVGKIFGDAFQSEHTEIPVRTDIYTTAEQFVIELELAGISKENVSIQIQESTLVIKGKKTGITNDIKPEHFLRKERKYGEFTRNFNLPPYVELESIKAKFENGVLTIRLALIAPPKMEEPNLNIPIE